MGLFSKGGLRILLALANCVFFVIGGVCVGVGAWMALDKLFISDVIGSDLFAAATYILIFSGCVIIIISFVGCVGAVMRNKPIVILYIGTVILAFIMLIIAGSVTASFSGELTENIKVNMRYSIQYEYGNNIYSSAENKRITQSWDTTQKMLKCCAVDDMGWSVYRDSQWFRQTNLGIDEINEMKYVPVSCCKYQGFHNTDNWIRNCQSSVLSPPGAPGIGAYNDALQYTGCFVAVKEFAKSNVGMMIAVGFVFGFVMLAGAVFGIMFYRRLREPFIPVATHER